MGAVWGGCVVCGEDLEKFWWWEFGVFSFFAPLSPGKTLVRGWWVGGKSGKGGVRGEFGVCLGHVDAKSCARHAPFSTRKGLDGMGEIGSEGVLCEKKKTKDTGDSRVIPHLSTNPACRTLSCKFGMGLRACS